VLRRAILAAADSSSAQRFVGRYGMRLGGARFVGGETLDEVVETIRRLNAQGLRTNTTLLGEGVHDRAGAEAVVREYEVVLQRIADERLTANLALKLTHLGVLLDEDLAYENLARLVDAAARLANFVRIDMEDSPLVDVTLRIYRRLRESGRENVGVVLQSYLYRSERDLEELIPLRPSVRLVKGAYLEPPDVAYPHKHDVDAAYVRLLERSLRELPFTAVATHDERLISHALEFADANDVPRDRFEIQMLYGVRPRLQLELVERGVDVRVATPYGRDWYPYLMRRLAERPANLLFFARSAIRK
jgi:proline dehydrogenase